MAAWLLAAAAWALSGPRGALDALQTGARAAGRASMAEMDEEERAAQQQHRPPQLAGLLDSAVDRTVEKRVRDTMR